MNNKLQELQEIVNKLSSTSSRLEKEQIIRDNSNNSYFIEMCKFLYDPMIVTGISDKKMERSDNSLFFNDLFEEEMEFLETLEYLKEHNTGTNESVDKICKYIANHKEYEDLLKKIYTKSLKLGIDATTINNVMGEGFIKTFDVMLEFAPIYGKWDDYHGDYKWQKLSTCARYYGYKKKGQFHDSLEDVRATLFCFYAMLESNLKSK